ncbi:MULTISPECIES: hypothetical protein [Novosphingobium]|uniref:Uncharacterized protein n=1 Tax=Novosphingobium mathurense TaxID=428990 RepID=A0A1U6HBB7_9SPHN|nr:MULTISPECIES: hypothetical protein [Novosphingobium]SLJ93082.1 hypothetical protein SAMN06295987_10251 [Novosphingobium mathurense]
MKIDHINLRRSIPTAALAQVLPVLGTALSCHQTAQGFCDPIAKPQRPTTLTPGEMP